eukprot:Nitzschia sp. Nitz4//scaffold24_size164493//52060//53331//NITZ4_002318-RA/size164493-processed-gene-0.103-mRNA-1//-1//CDS//3329544084//147//frame0
MKILSNAAFLVLFLTNVLTVTATSVVSDIDTVIMQLRSISDSDSEAMLAALKEASTDYLNKYFTAYYDSVGQSDYFDSVTVTTNSYGIQGVTGSFMSTVEIEGELTFTADPTPTSSFVSNLVTNAFQGSNLDLYLQAVLNSEDTFLEDLTHVIVEIDEESVVERSFGEDANDASAGVSDEDTGMNLWGKVAIYTAVGVVTGVLLFFGFTFLYQCCFSSKQQVQDDVVDMKGKQIEIPTPEIVMTSTTRRASQGRAVGGASPGKSVMSTDSSMFTYNQAGVSREIGTLSLGSISNINVVDNSNFDVHAWQQKNVISTKTPAPFGLDISAIEQRDQLSLIEEGNECVSRSRSQPKKNRSSLEVRNSKPRRPVPSTRRPQKAVAASQRTIYPTLEEGNSTSSDVINDLKNLSLQIDRHRRSRPSRD